MLNLLIVSATSNETRFIHNNRLLNPSPDGIFYIDHPHLNITLLITGIGMVATTYSLTKVLKQKKFDLVLNTGIAGSFDRSIKKGEVVHVTEDMFTEIGAEDGHSFISVFDLGLADKNESPFKNGVIPARNKYTLRCLDRLRKVKGCTVNSVHGNDLSIKNVMEQFHPEIESMEGAAVFYVCSLEKINCIQVRAISNYVEKRNRPDWKIEMALENLSFTINEILNELPR